MEEEMVIFGKLSTGAMASVAENLTVGVEISVFSIRRPLPWPVTSESFEKLAKSQRYAKNKKSKGCLKVAGENSRRTLQIGPSKGKKLPRVPR